MRHFPLPPVRLTQRRHTVRQGQINQSVQTRPCRVNGKLATGIGAQSFRFATRPEPRAWAEFRVRHSREPARISIQSWHDKSRSGAHPSGEATGSPPGVPYAAQVPPADLRVVGERRSVRESLWSYIAAGCPQWHLFQMSCSSTMG
ncbi:hypothetical protein MRX96_024384 [Rhipicephalus microplus]